MNDSVLSQVHFLANYIQSTGAKGYRKWFDIGISEFRLLVVISNEPGCTGARIHEVMGLDLGAISRSLRKMEQRELVFSTAHARHPSYRCWYITDTGAAMHDQVHRMTKIREKSLLRGFSKADVFQLLSYLHRMLENVGDLEQIADEGIEEAIEEPPVVEAVD